MSVPINVLGTVCYIGVIDESKKDISFGELTLSGMVVKPLGCRVTLLEQYHWPRGKGILLILQEEERPGNTRKRTPHVAAMRGKWPITSMETAGRIWNKTTERDWPIVSLGLIRGATPLSFEDDYSKDSERLRILISMTIWAIWKSSNKNSINDQEVAAAETRETLKGLIQIWRGKAGRRRVSWKTVGG